MDTERNIIQLGFEMLKQQLLIVVQNQLINYYGPNWQTGLEKDPNIDQELFDSLYNTNLFYKNSDIKNLLLVFSHQWNPIFAKLFTNKYPHTLCELLVYYQDQWAYEYKFSIRETYKVIDTIQSFMEELKMTIADIDLVRNEILYFYTTEQFKLNSNLYNNLAQNYVSLNTPNIEQEVDQNLKTQVENTFPQYFNKGSNTFGLYKQYYNNFYYPSQ